MRILLVSQMYPGPDDPDLGVFVASLERELAARGHEIERAAVERRGGRGRHLRLARDARRAARAFHPDVVYAHFLVPAGLAAAMASPAPLVVTAHGQDVANIGQIPGVRAATRFVVKRAAAVVAVSDWLRARLEQRVPEAVGKIEVIDCGVDLDRFAPRDAAEARAELGLMSDGTAFLCLGSLTERKNVLRLARAFERRGEGTLDLRRRRPATRCARAPGRDPPRRPRPARRGPALDRRRGRRLSAESRRAVRARDPRGARVGALGRRHEGRRTAGVRPSGGGCPRRPRRRRCSRRRAGRRCRPPVPEPGRPSGCRAARRQAAGGSGGGDPSASRWRSASLTSTSGRTDSSSPASRASASASS